MNEYNKNLTIRAVETLNKKIKKIISVVKVK